MGSFYEAGNIYHQLEEEEVEEMEKADLMALTALCGATIKIIKNKHGNEFPMRYPSPDASVFNVTVTCKEK